MNNYLKENSGLIFVGCMFIGVGIGFYFNATSIGAMIGMGVGFLAMGILSIIKPSECQTKDK